jgi:2-polyprenyl-6-methoxyphenol hydroxylase-like FAD-dependent oxidoreductase
MQPVHVAIAGGGPAGLTAAALLGRFGGDALQVTLLTGGARDELADSFPIGLWSCGLRALEVLGGLRRSERKGKYMRDSGYRCRDGRWLARPTSMGSLSLQPQTPASILFVSQAKVLKNLRTLLAPSVHVLEENLVHADNHADGVTLYTENATIRNVDALIGADGRYSVVRRILRAARGHDDIDMLYRGYRLYRGISPVALTEDAFQTWGRGARFASVPLLGGQVWYAAISGPPLGTTSGVPSTMVEEDFSALRGIFSDWHDPIDRLITSTPIGSCIVENAVAASAIPLMDLGRVALIGDAAHCIDPILALGASLGMEDAHVLTAALLSVKEDEAIPGTIQRVARQRRQRARALAALSGLAQSIGELNSERAVSLRDATMLALPERLKRSVFDRILRYASASWPSPELMEFR